MFQIKQTQNNRWQITATYNFFPTLPQNIATAILWRSYASAQEAFSAAAEFHFQICDKAAA